MPDFVHRTVLREATVEAVRPRDGGVYVDLTSGGGGHGELLLERSAPGGRLVAFDRDPRAVEATRARLARFGDRVTLENAPFSTAPERLRALGLDRASGRGVDGIVADLGVSSPQLDQADRGFSINGDGPLDMRMGDQGPTAAELIDSLDADELADVLYELGEIRESRRLARAIKADRAAGTLETTGQLAELCVRVLGRKTRSHHPATLAFQALRIAVNAELDELDAILAALPALLADGGRAAFISFHSLEDRRVKLAFRALGSPPELPRGLPVLPAAAEPDFRLVGKPIVPPAVEAESNPRARSARLRVIERIAKGVPHA